MVTASFSFNERKVDCLHRTQICRNAFLYTLWLKLRSLRKFRAAVLSSEGRQIRLHQRAMMIRSVHRGGEGLEEA